jgi:hypothetical protein
VRVQSRKRCPRDAKFRVQVIGKPERHVCSRHIAGAVSGDTATVQAMYEEEEQEEEENGSTSHRFYGQRPSHR